MLFKRSCQIYAVVFLIFAVVGFILFKLNYLPPYFKSNTPLSILYVLTAIFATVTVFTKRFYQRLYFQIIGFIYAVLAMFGFIFGESAILGLIANDVINTWFHLIVALVALVLGFGTKKREI